MSEVLVTTYQILVTALLIILFIAFWSKTMIVNKIIIIDSKIDRIINEHAQLHNFSLNEVNKLSKKIQKNNYPVGE